MSQNEPESRPIAELRDSGLLWLINRIVFHARGVALAVHVDDHGMATGWSLQGNGTEPWSFPEDQEKVLFQRAMQTLRNASAGQA